ncbi:glutamine amidotransferase [Microbacterium capsulatum]|uniref:Lipid II isoglutaminyl synthase (glutamine-hydrolyzing) subunit GatD n=1 Tax=Microbacterium capsulatum TaxID=3041921 RepID=A0ABU0XCK7_9MICO|nr:glutamine amidotransferase [Microbacterium sp. ASV81]MDQ4212692.1 glutamine amidotransferase [Microbacterium sp. ASV81]
MTLRQAQGAIVKIVQLYPQELGVTGDRGNVRALETRLERAGIPVEVVHVGIGDATPADADVVILGNGPLSAMRIVADDLRARRDELSAAIDAGVAVLAVGAGAELLSDGVALLDGEVLDGLGILPLRVERTRERRVGYVIADTVHGRLIGFEDHASEWALGEGAEVYGTVVAGKGSFPRGAGSGETIRVRNVFATNVQGPVLPLNPQLSDEILRIAAERRGHSYRAGAEHDALNALAAGARKAIEDRVGDEVFTYMKV